MLADWGADRHLDRPGDELVVVQVAVGVEVRLDELDGGIVSDEGGATYLQHGNARRYLEQTRDVRRRRRGPYSGRFGIARDEGGAVTL